MEKILYALWKAPRLDLSKWNDLLLNEVAPKLADANGARFLQLHLHVPELSEGSEIEVGNDIPDAALSVWLNSAHEAGTVEGLLASKVERWAGFSVVESSVLPFAGEPGANGEMPGFSQLAFFTARPGLPRSEFLRIWMERHTINAITTQETFLYTQNIVNRPLTPAAPDWMGIVDEWYPEKALTDQLFYWRADGNERRKNYNYEREIGSVLSFAGLDGMVMMISKAYRIGNWSDYID